MKTRILILLCCIFVGLLSSYASSVDMEKPTPEPYLANISLNQDDRDIIFMGNLHMEAVVKLKKVRFLGLDFYNIIRYTYSKPEVEDFFYSTFL